MKVNFVTQAIRKVSQILCVGILVLASVLGLPSMALNATPTALANPYYVGISGVGVRDQVEGAAKQAQGRAQQDLGRTKNAIDNAGNQVEGRAKQDLARTKGALNQTKARVESKAKQDAARTQSQIEQAGAKADQAGNTVVDAVKDFFGQ
jgi:uncharacterized protein YjbJ (UPF0337 family)